MTGPAVAPEHAPGPDRLCLLGGFELGRDGVEVRLHGSGQRLIAALALRGRMSRASAVGLLWPDSTEARARGSLRTALWRLQRSCPGVVRMDSDRLDLCESVDVDARSFVRTARRVVEQAPATDDDLRSMIDVGCDELLPDWYDDWVVIERERVRQLRLHALERAALALGRRGRSAAAVELAINAIRLDPLRESAHRTLIVLHLAENNAAEAVLQLGRCRALLRAELGIDPSPDLQQLVAGAVGGRG